MSNWMYWVLHHRKTVLAGLLIITAIMVAGLAQITFDFSPQYVFQSASPEFAKLKEYRKTYGKQDNVIVVILKSDGFLTSSNLQYLAKLGQSIDEIDGMYTESLLQFLSPDLRRNLDQKEIGNKVQAEVAQQIWLKRLFISDDNKTVGLYIHFDENLVLMEKIQPLIRRLTAKLDSLSPPSGVEVHLTGIPYLRSEIVDKLKKDQMTFLPLSAIIFTFILYYLFGRLSLVVIPFSAIGLTLIWTVGIMGWWGKSIDIVNNILPTLIFTIAISDAIHLMSRYLQDAARGMDQRQCLVDTMNHLAVACFFTSFTTAIGFISLGIADIDILRSFGYLAALGVLLAYFLTIVLIPILLTYTAPVSVKGAPSSIEWKFDGLANFVLGRPKTVLAVSLIILGTAAFYGSKVDINNYMLEALQEDEPLYIASRLSEKELAGLIPMGMIFTWSDDRDLSDPEILQSMDNIEKVLTSHPGIRYVMSPAKKIKEAKYQMARRMNPSGAERTLPKTKQEAELFIGFIKKFKPKVWADFVRPDLNQARLVAYGQDHGVKEFEENLPRLEKAIEAEEKRVPGLKLELTGLGPVAAPGLQRLVKDLRDSLFLAFIIIFVAMTLLFRSIKVGLISLVPNLAPLVLAYGYLGWAGLDLQTSTIFVFPVALGLAVDDTIHFLVRYGEACGKGKSVADALRETYAGAGRAIIFTSILLGIGFLVVYTSQFPITQRFAILMLIIIFGAILGDLFLLPAFIYLFGIRMEYHAGGRRDLVGDLPDQEEGTGLRDLPDQEGTGLRDLPDQEGTGLRDLPDQEGTGLRDLSDQEGTGLRDLPDGGGEPDG